MKKNDINEFILLSTLNEFVLQQKSVSVNRMHHPITRFRNHSQLSPPGFLGWKSNTGSLSNSMFSKLPINFRFLYSLFLSILADEGS